MGRYRTQITAEPGQQQILIGRMFDAPRELVFEAFTDPKHLVQWLGPRELVMSVDVFEPRSGGSWRYIHKDKNGNAYAFHGVFHEVQSPERIIQTFEFEGLPEKGHVTLETVKFESLSDGKTRVIMLSVFQSVADRDAMLQSGMERGVVEGHERLDELFEKLLK